MINQRFICALAALGLMCSSSAQAHDLPARLRPIMRSVDRVIAATANANVQAVASLYTSDAVVVDDQAPLRWTGATAGQDWLSTVGGKWGKLNVARFTAKGDPADIEVARDIAYVVVQGVLTSTVPGKPFRREGAFTFTLRKVADGWKISSQAWTNSY